jgi:AcrR family transcriptional regulator
MLTVRGRPRSAEADRAIAEAAVALLGEFGYANVTMAGVAARAGVSTATLYRRFSSKEELVASAVELIVDRSEPADTGSLEGDLRETLSRMAAKMTGDQGAFLLGLAGELIRHPQLRDALRDRLSAPMRDSMMLMLERAVRRGEIQPVDDPDLALAFIVGPLHYRILVDGLPVDTDDVERLLPMVLGALGYAPA